MTQDRSIDSGPAQGRYVRGKFAVFVRIASLGLACAVGVSACRAQDNRVDSPAMPVAQLLCIYTPSACNNKRLLDLYSSPPDKVYERRFQRQTIHIPMGYVSDTELLVDPRDPTDSKALYLVALLPDLLPRTPANLREFFIPYDHNKINIDVGPRKPGATPWEAAQLHMMRSAGESLSPTRRPDKFGLSVVGEDFDKFPNRRPCGDANDAPPSCKSPHPRDILRPMQSGGERSLMLCDPDILGDIDAKVAAMPETERDAWYASKAWFGRRRAMCTHYMYYGPLNASVRMSYPRRFIAQWQQTESLVRDLLDRARAPESAAPMSPASVPASR